MLIPGSEMANRKAIMRLALVWIQTTERHALCLGYRNLFLEQMNKAEYRRKMFFIGMMKKKRKKEKPLVPGSASIVKSGPTYQRGWWRAWKRS